MLMEDQIIQKYIIKDITKEILQYANEYILLEWIDINKLNWNCLSLNPNAIHLLEKNQEKINWVWLSLNPNAIDLLEKNLVDVATGASLEKIDWDNVSVSENLNAIYLLERNPEKINWRCLSRN